MSIKSKDCEIPLDNLNKAHKEREAKESELQQDLKEYFPITDETKDKYEKQVVNVLKKQYGTATAKEKAHDALVKKAFPKDFKRMQLIFKIRALLEGYPLYKTVMLDYLTSDVKDIKGLPKGKDSTIEQELKSMTSTFVTQQGKKYRHINLDKLPIAKLTKLYHLTNNAVNLDGQSLLGGWFGNLRVSFATARDLSLKDKTGSIAYMYRKTTDFAGNIQQVLVSYLSKTSKRNFGIEDINRQVADIYNTNVNLTDESKYGNEKAVKYKLHTYYNKLMNGWMKFEDGVLKIHANFGAIKATKEKGKFKYLDGFQPDGEKIFKTKLDAIRFKKSQDSPVSLQYYDKYGNLRYEKTNDKVHDYSNLMKLEDYIDGKGLNKEDLAKFKAGNISSKDIEFRIQMQRNYLPLKQEDIQTIIDATKNGRKLHDQVFEDLNKRHKKLIENYTKELKRQFKNKNLQQLKEIFVNNKPYGKNWTRQEKIRAANIKKIFGNRMMFEVFTSEGNALEYKKDSYPVMYYSSDMLRMLDDSIESLNINIIALKDQIIEAKDPLKVQLRSQLKELEKSLNWATDLRDSHDSTQDDPRSDGKIYNTIRANHFKHISNMFDIREMREDQNVYTEYLRKTYSTLSRSQLALDGLVATRLANSRGVDPFLTKYVQGIYSRVMGDPDAPARLFGVDFNSKRVFEGIINSMPGKSGDVLFRLPFNKVERYIRNINSYFTAMHLGGVGTAGLNLTAMIQKIQELGYTKTKESLDALKGENSALWNDLIKRSGVLEFSEFFSDSLVRDTSGRLEISQEDAIGIVKAQIEYRINIDKGMSLVNARKLFDKKVDVYIKTIPDLKRLKNRLGELKSKKRQMFINKLANYAITKDFNVVERKGAIGKIKKGAAKVLEGLAIFPKKYDITMSGTEKTLRSTSFISGINSAINNGILPISFIQDYKKFKEGKIKDQELYNQIEDDIKVAIEYGKEATRHYDFGLSNQDVGEANLIGGGFFTKFKYWSQQKYGRDIRLFRDAYLGFKSIDKTGQFDSTALGKTFKELLKSMGPTGVINRKTFRDNPDIGKLRNFILTSGTATIIMDLLVGLPFVRNAFYRVALGRKLMGGITSDVISMFISTPIYLLIALLNDDDEEEIQEKLYWKMKHIPFVGFGTTFVIDQLYLLISQLIDSDDEELSKNLKHTNRAINPIGGIPLIGRTAREFTDEAIEAIIEN